MTEQNILPFTVHFLRLMEKPSVLAIKRKRSDGRQYLDTRKQKELFEAVASVKGRITLQAAQNVFMLYRGTCSLHSVPNPKTKNCRDNPYCIHRLGGEKWDKLLQKIECDGRKSLALNNRRDLDKVPCGLVNLGNSCYVNSFLQIYFNDPVFRQCVYDWKPVVNYSKPAGAKLDIQELMLCLQRLFVTMQITPYEDTNAEKLVKILRLDDSQNDAMEFQILFFQILDKYLADREEWISTKSAIKARFEGKIEQIISCKCGKRSSTILPFNPLSLGIDKVKFLTKAIDNYFCAEELPEYKCDICGIAGETVKHLVIKEPPPVVILQVNRFTYDCNGRKKKVKSALQYPRVLDLKDVKYELCAVMVHEGPNADSGHYFDIIRHPGTKKWWNYNDEIVQLSPVPGVATEKIKVSKTTADMKGCYALVYRTESETVLENNVVIPEKLSQSIAMELEMNFDAQTAKAQRSNTDWKERVQNRQKVVLGLWQDLEVKKESGSDINFYNVVFLPTSLLKEIQSREMDAVSDRITSYAKKSDESAQGGVCSNCTNVCSTVPSQKEKEPFDDFKSISSHLFPLCEHGRISLHAVLDGSIKAVNRSAAVRLLKCYNINISSSMEENSEGSIFDLRSGRNIENQKDECKLGSKERKTQTKKWRSKFRKSKWIRLDICTACITTLKAEAEFVERLENAEKKARELLKERVSRFFHSENCFWVSTRHLMQYRKMVMLAREQRIKRPASFECLIFDSAMNSAGSELVLDCQPSTSFNAPEVKNTCGTPRTQKPKLEEISELSNCPSMMSVRKRSKSFSASGSPLKVRRFEVKDDTDIVRKTYSASGFENHDVMDETRKISTEGHKEHYSAKKETKGVLRDSSVNGCENEAIDNSTDGICEETSKSEEESYGSQCETPSSIKEYEEECCRSDDDQAVVFNQDLICKHGKFDYNAYTTKERKIVVEKEEWHSLVDGFFDLDQQVELTTDQLPCDVCEERHKMKSEDNEDRRKRAMRIRNELAELIRTLSKRKVNDSAEQGFSRVICRTFVRNMSTRSGSRRISFPELCQSCLLCDLHRLPCVELGPNSMAIPITSNEWNHITEVMRSENEAWIADEILLNATGEFEKFCEECFLQRKLEEENKRFIYERGAEIYVRLKGDENEEPSGADAERKIATSPLLRLPGHSTTRRAVAKSSMRFCMSSSDTIRDLKIKICEKIGQAPSDQLIYMGDRLLEDWQTLQEARVDPKELHITPLVLHVQQCPDFIDQPRQIERGFRDTALSC
ncbi:hypothetical protein AB6A40_000453 [Gnathostoma spinigerum]|uniref:ubiquitinyl hydrolase 1 n=1 Tax=Gnathostoma spinigerum TaxID=75299 RepID=A0ABD6E8Q8_9BILA